MSWNIYGHNLSSHFLLGTARYPSPKVMIDSIKASETEIVTVSLRREEAGDGSGKEFWSLLNKQNLKVLPNTAGCHSVKEAVTTAHMARDLFDTRWIKLELIGNDETLQPHVFDLIEATRILIADGFQVFPYTTEDLIVAEKLVDLGCEVVMPWGAPIGTGKGLQNISALRSLRQRLPDTKLIIDAGVGSPSHACHAMELGFDGVLLNTAVATAIRPEIMAKAFKTAIEAGHAAFEAGLMHQRDVAVPSTPTVGVPFWHESSL